MNLNLMVDRIKELETERDQESLALDILADWPYQCPPEMDVNCRTISDYEECKKCRLAWARKQAEMKRREKKNDELSSS